LLKKEQKLIQKKELEALHLVVMESLLLCNKKEQVLKIVYPRSERVSSGEGERRDMGYNGGASIGFSAGTSPKDNSLSFKSKVLDKIADFTGVNVNLNGGAHYNQNYSTEKGQSNSTQLTNDQAFAKETIDYINNKYKDKEYIKSNMSQVFEEANKYQESLMKKEKSSGKVKSNSQEGSNISNELNEFEKPLKDKK
jgi:hypothetical protein